MPDDDTPGPPLDDDLRAVVVRLTTSRCDAYAAALAAGAGVVTSAGSYTIPSDVLAPAPRPTVPLAVYSDADGAVLAAERVQAVYRDSGATVTDPATGRVYTRFTFYVLVSLDVATDGGGTVNSFAWAADPETGGTPPYDAASGTQGFGFDPAWTGVAI